MSGQSPFSRRQFVRTVGLTAAGAAFTQACSALRIDPTETPIAIKEETLVPTHTPSATPTAQPLPAATPESMIGRVALVKTDDRTFGWSKTMKRVLVVPWSIAATYFGMASSIIRMNQLDFTGDGRVVKTAEIRVGSNVEISANLNHSTFGVARGILFSWNM